MGEYPVLVGLLVVGGIVLGIAICGIDRKRRRLCGSCGFSARGGGAVDASS